MDKIGVVGLGNVGNAVRIGFESKGYEVLSYDNSKNCNSSLPELAARCDFVFICVPTPTGPGGQDLTILDEVMDSLAEYIPVKTHWDSIHSTVKHVLVIKSTVIPGTCDNYATKWQDLPIVYNPEFLDGKTAVKDFLNPSSTVIGYTHWAEWAASNLETLYSEAGFGPCRRMTSTEAEMVKYMVNTYYTTKVIFANQMKDVCLILGIDYEVVRLAFERDKRVAPGNFKVAPDGLKGFGGRCLPKDLDAFLSEFNVPLLEKVRDLNKEYRGEE